MTSRKEPGSLSEAIDMLESVGQSKVQELREHLEKDFKDIQKSLDSLRPLMDDLKNKAESEAKSVKSKVEEKAKENIWGVIGVVGLLAFVLGWIFGSQRK